MTDKIELDLRHAKTLCEMGRSYLRICKEVETDMRTDQHEALDALRDECRYADKLAARARRTKS